MYLESLTIKNFRKFKDKNNTVYFVGSKEIKAEQEEEGASLVAPSSTLIIGKNNSGKTTIAEALNFIANKKKPKAHDFNIGYLRDLLQCYEKALNDGGITEELKPPSLEFKLSIRINIAETEGEDEGDLVNNLYQFVQISSSHPDLVEIIIKCQTREDEVFRNEILNIITADYSHIKEDELISLKKFEKLCDFLNADKNIYKLIYETSTGTEVPDPSLGDLIRVKEIKANRHLKEGILSEVYQKIISTQYAENKHDRECLNKSIENINKEIDGSVGEKSGTISSVLKVIEKSNHVGVKLTGDVTEKAILRNLIKYSFSEGQDFIPEDQFGLGYINLLNIIGEIIYYIEGYEERSYQDRINLLFIEEPEAFMHPQMQEFFITRIDKAVKKILELYGNKEGDNEKILHCQIAITTHSSHIVNSKIHSCNSFDHINYLIAEDKVAEVVKLDDEAVCGDHPVTSEELIFIKKHIKYKVSELFFSDAVIFVEGVTEETLLHFYLDKDPTLRHYYISIFNVIGAHSKFYYPLIKALKVPCLIITDLDIKREPCEKNTKNSAHKPDKECEYCGKTKDDKEDHKIYRQVNSLKDRVSTNDTFKRFYQKDKISSGDNDVNTKEVNGNNTVILEGITYFEEDNLHVVFQKDPIKGQYATSFEEAFILSNYSNEVLNKVLKQCKPNIYKGIVGREGEEDYAKLINKSFELQRKLANSKSEFANRLLYQVIISNEGGLPKLPKYIQDGVNWLSKRLHGPATVKEEASNVASTSK